MTNPHYNDSGGPGSFSRARSANIRSEFANIELGFDSVELLKANVNSPTFTGLASAPTASIASTGQQLATLDFVRNFVGASVLGLPAPSAGRVLASLDGVSWTTQVLIPFASAPTAFKTPRQNAAGSAYEMVSIPYGIGSGGIQSFTASGSAVEANPIIDIKTAPYGTIVTLPSALTLPVGYTFVFGQCDIDEGAAGLVTAGGDLVAGSSALSGQAVKLVSNTTSDGGWRRIDKDLNILPTSALRYMQGQLTVAAAAATDNLRAVVDVNFTGDVLLASVDATTDAIALRLLRLGANLTVSVVTTVNVTGAVGTVDWMKIVRTSTGWVVCIRVGALVKMVALTISGDVITAGALTTVVSGGATVFGIDVAANGDRVVVAYGGATGSVRAWGATISGTTVTPSAAAFIVDSTMSANALGLRISITAVASTADKFVVAYSGYESTTPSNVTSVRMLNATGSTPVITAGTAQALASAVAGAIAVFYRGPDGDCIAITRQRTSGVLRAYHLALTPATNSISVTGPVTWGTASGTGSANMDNITCTVGYFDSGSGIIAIAGSADFVQARLLSISGTTITPAGSGLMALETGTDAFRSTVTSADGQAIFIGRYTKTGLGLVRGEATSLTIAGDAATGMNHSHKTALQYEPCRQVVANAFSSQYIAVTIEQTADINVRAIWARM